MTQNLSRSLTIALCVLALGTSTSALAERYHYRWVDQNGETVYSDVPPPRGVDYEIVSTTTGFTRAVGAGEGALRGAGESGKVGSEFEQAKRAEGESGKKNADLCSRARSNLESLSSDAKIKVRGADGSERFLTEQEKQLERETARSQITIYCE